MSSTTDTLRYLWEAKFTDGHEIVQPADDRYSKHVEGAEHNGTAFTDVMDYLKDHELAWFYLVDQYDKERMFGVDFTKGEFWTAIAGLENVFSLEEHQLTDRKLVFNRVMRWDRQLTTKINNDGDAEIVKEELSDPYVYRYMFGYEGKDSRGRVRQCIVYLDA